MGRTGGVSRALRVLGELQREDGLAHLQDAVDVAAGSVARLKPAKALVLSPHTVEGHTKSLYEKVGVTSRQQLVAQVFLDEC